MATKPKSVKRRRPGRKAEDIRLVWKEQAPKAVFAGKPLVDLEASLAELQQSNVDLKIRDQARSAAVKTRDDKLKSLATLLRNIVKGVQGHPEYGEDSPLYRAMGFVPFSERSSGLTRRSKAGSSPPAGKRFRVAHKFGVYSFRISITVPPCPCLNAFSTSRPSR